MQVYHVGKNMVEQSSTGLVDHCVETILIGMH